MSKRKKKQHHDEHIDESWLIPYADILTLLLALFIVLFATSSVDAKKFQSMSEVFSRTFSGGTGIFEYPSPMPSGNMESLDKEKKTGAEQDKKQKETQQNKGLSAGELKGLTEVQAKIESYIQQKKLTGKLDTALTGEGLLVTIRDNVLFESGKADVRPQDRMMAKEISALLVMDPPRNIIISGHTDNVPISNSQYGSNWELSVMRAINFMKLVLENPNLKPQWFSAKGFGEFQPIAPNDTPEGKAKNRRVEILILPNDTKTTDQKK